MKSSNKPPADPTETDVFTVSRLNREARRILEAGLPPLWVAGEISNLAQPGSGHIYFSLKDEQAQVRCAMFRNANQRLGFTPEDGAQVLVQAKVSIYEARGSYQLIVEHMEAAGEGVLRRRLEELKRKLSEAGLFDEQHKQALPTMPGRIGIITSPTGAAVRDILHILARRYPAVPVVIYPTRVQGSAATDEIVAAINQADERAECDVLIVARGGGSLEDLWCFNEEKVARAIYACSIPTISGVGHEVDFTICDMVADVRAPTPSGAAEIAVPEMAELLRGFKALDRRTAKSVERIFATRKDNFRQLHARLTRMHPGTSLRQLDQRTDELTRQLSNNLRHYLQHRKLNYAEIQQRLQSTAPLTRIRHNQEQARNLQARMQHTLERQLDRLKNHIALAAGSLHAVSPLATLERGYAIVSDANSGKVLRSAAKVKQGDRIDARLASGRLTATVDKVTKERD